MNINPIGSKQPQIIIICYDNNHKYGIPYGVITKTKGKTHDINVFV
jgi:hypothetical protein